MLRTAVLGAAIFAALGSGGAWAQSAQRVPDGSYLYRWSAGDQIVGQANVTVAASGSSVLLTTSSMITKGALSQANITFGASRLEFRSYRGFTSSYGTDLSIDLAVQNGAVRGTTKTQAFSYPINVAPFGASAVFAVDDGLLGTFLFLPAQMRAAGATSFQLLTALSGTSGSITYTTSTYGPYPYGVPTNDVVVNIGPDTIIWYNPRTLVVDQFTRADLVARLVGP